MGSKARVDVLWIFLQTMGATAPPYYYSQADLVRLTGHRLQSVQNVLEALCSPEIGIIGYAQSEAWWDGDRKNSYKGRKMYYLNRKHPWVPALRMLLENATGAISILRDELNKLDGIEVAFVFGSFATSEQTPESDIDLMVIGSQTLKSMAVPISKIEKRIKRKIDFFTITPEKWREHANARNHFVYSTLTKPKLFIKGDNERLERITAG